MSDAADTEAVTRIPEAVETITLPSNDVPPSGNELPIESPQPDEDARPSSEKIKPPSNASSKHEGSNIARKSNGGGETAEGAKESKKSNKMERKKLPTCPPPQSRCRARSRDMKQCKKHYREMIGQHEIRNDELEQRETDLRQRLEMLECSMPAVMVWNIWRMAQGAPVSHLRDIVTKQFLEPATGFPTCPSTPSQHWDCRVREVEAERKQAHHRAVEARQVLAAKDEALKAQKKQIEEAKKLQEERKTQIAKLEEEVKRLRDALKKAQGDENSCETGECGEIQCRQMWLQGKNSISSIHSTDLECLARLQDLAEAELCMKRQIADLERRECAYMRTLQQADEMWAKMETDNASDLAGLQDQLDAKIAANQQLADRIVELEDEIEKLHTQLTKASLALQEYKEKTFTDVGLGDVDVSTMEKIEQTEQGVEVATSIKGSEMDMTKVAEEGIAGPAAEMTPIEGIDQTELNVSEHSVITVEESVQVEPELSVAETQSMAMKPGQEKETSTEEQSQELTVESVEVTDRVEETATVTEIGSRGSMNQTAEQQDGITGLGQGPKPEAVHSNEIVAAAESSLHLLTSPTEEKDLEVSGTGKAGEDSADQKEAIQVAAKPAPTPVFDRISDTTTKTPTEPAPESVGEKSSETPTKASVQALPEAVTEATLEPNVDTVTRSTVEAKVTEPLITTTPQPIKTTPRSSLKPDIEPVPTPRSVSTAEPARRPTTEPAMEAEQPPPLEIAVEAGHQRTPEPVVEALDVDPDKHVAKAMESPTDTFAVPIEILVSWHTTVICAHRQISVCPQCSSTSGKMESMLNEMRTFLGENAPDSAKIECAEGGPVEMSVTEPSKKGRCICKPKTCPLGEIATTTPPQASVKIQTVVDGQSQTSMPVRIPSRESKSSKSSKAPIKITEEPRLTSIAESAETDLEIQRAKSIPEAKDVSTVTVGDIASQTEAIRRASSSTKKDEKTCVCPTGVCPKKTTEVSCGECIPGIPCSSSKKPRGKEYKSTADTILAPAIKILPCNERRSSPSPVKKAISNDTTSESGSFSCCLCGKPVTPVASKKITSIPVPTRSLFKGKVISPAEGSDTDFLCCACKAKDATSMHSKNSIYSKASEKFTEVGRAVHKGKTVAGGIKTSCSREICCPCSEEGTHAVRKPQKDELDIAKPKVKPETKDVCCLAKISRDKGSKSEAHRRKNKESIKTGTPSVSECGSCQMSTSSSSNHRAPKTNEDSNSNVCCSSIEQVIGMTKKKGKGIKCACNAKEGKVNKEGCVCGESSPSALLKKPSESTKSIQRTPSCICK